MALDPSPTPRWLRLGLVGYFIALAVTILILVGGVIK